jgi:hypothetical protein
MDTLRSNFGSSHGDDERRDDDFADDDTGVESPPAGIGTDERRMQVRAYNHWASLLDERSFPSIEDLEPARLPDFGPYSVLLDFSRGIDDPSVRYLGKELATECGADGPIATLADVPSRSLLSRITDHYMQILANQAPIGFEAEFVNQRGATILYRGILLPYSSDGETIDFIFGVINWKEIADQLTTDELLLEIDQALGEDDPVAASLADRTPGEVTDWADGPGADIADLPLTGEETGAWEDGDLPAKLPQPLFGMDIDALASDLGEEEEEEEFYDEDDGRKTPSRFASLLGVAPPPSGGYQPHDDDGEDDTDWAERALTHPVEAIRPPVLDQAFDEADYDSAETEPLGLHDCLAAARELAQRASGSEDRTRAALYAAVGRAYDVSIAAEAEPEEFAELVAESGLTMQDRAPMTPVVKLVFGAGYDKTRLTEYAAVLTHAHRAGVERGHLAEYLRGVDGGLKGVVAAERQLRREESGRQAAQLDRVREALAQKLRALEPLGLDDLAPEGGEFALVMIRRIDGEAVVLGEVPQDVPLIERAARKLLG